MKFLAKFKNILSVVLIILIVFVFSGIGVFATPKPAQATWPTIDLGKLANDVIVAVWKFAVFPLIKSLVLKVASGDLSLNGLEILNWGSKEMWFQSLQSALYSYTGFSLCSDIKMNMRIAFARSASPGVGGAGGAYVPDCTFDRSIIKKTLDAINELEKQGKAGQDTWKILETEFNKRFALSLTGQNNDFSTWFGMRTTAAEQMAQKEQNYRFELMVNQGFFGARDCSNIKPDTKVAAAKGDTKGNKKSSAVKKPIDKYRDCRVKSPGLVFAENAKKSISGLQQGTIQAQAYQDMITLTALTIDTIIQTALTGLWTSPNQSAPKGTEFQMSGQNRAVEIPKEGQAK
ncbi:hypothetical protein KKC60_03440 [Patescibacteria group bacterium]|nr:hypothetical protein [Patescibacteria group bacterium]